MKKFLCFLLIVTLLVGLLPPMAFAATVGVTSYSDLAAAIAAAPADGTVTTIELENSFSATGGVLTIATGQNIVITSAAGSTFTFTQATAGQRHFSVAGSLTLQNVTLSGPGGTTLGGGINVSGGSLTVATGATITSCNAPGGFGGAASLTHNSTFTMTGGTISGNTAATGGGGLDIENGYATISGGTISGNVVTSAGGFGGGIYLKAANLTMSGGVIANNRANNGGGIYVDSSGAINMTAGTISNNVAAANGGGIYTAQYTTNNPLPPNSYINLTIGASVIFSDNVAGSGARIPPSNVGNTNIATTNTSSVFGNPLNNLDINYFGSAGVMVMYLTVTFDPGANGTFPAGTQTQQSIPTTNSPLVPSAPIPMPQPSASYGFIGWSSDGGGTILTSAQVLITPISDNTTYVAQYAPPITLIFNWQDSATPTTQTVTPVQVTGTYASALSQATMPTRIGYVFRGWFTTPNGSASGVQILPTSIVAIGTPNPTTLYAWWIQDPTVTIIFDGNNGTPTEQLVSGRVVGDSYASTLAAVTTPTRIGYTFNGWNTAADGTGTQVIGTDMILGAATLYAQWIPIPPITVTYLAQGGVPDGQTQTVVTGYTYGDASPAISPPTQPGYAFVGWFTAPTGGTQILPTTVVTATTNQTLYAQWVSVTVTVTFDAGNGTPATQVVSGLVPLTSYAPVLAAIQAPTQVGYLFNGWHDQPQGMGGSSVTAGSLIPPTSSTVYAWWTPNPTITVTFNAMGGSPTMETEPVTTGDTYAAALAAVTEPTLAGSTFVGWFTDPTGGVQILDTTVVTVTANQTLYARWVSVTVTITFDPNDNMSADQVVSGQPIGSTYATALNAITTPTQPGYTFNGWNTAADGTGATITASSTIPNENTMVYAQWTPLPPVTVTFDSQGGEFDEADVILGSGVTLSSDWTLAYYHSVTIGGTFLQAMSATPDPYPPNDGNTYSFGGWWTEPDGGGTQVLPTDTVTDAMLDSSGDNITLYVLWITVPTVTLTFDAQGGTPATQVRRGAVVGNDIDASLFIQAPTRVGYTFDGWFPAQSGGTPILDTDAIPSTNTTYYAQWTQIPPITVIFDSQGGYFDPADAIPGDGTTFSIDYTLAYHTPVTIGGTFMQAMAATPNPYPPSNAYSFGGWWTTPNGDDSGVQVLPTSTVWNEPGDITLYVHWIPVPAVTITFDGNGGILAEQIVPGQLPEDTYAAALASITTPTQNGFIFAGWNTAEDGSGAPITPNGPPFIPPTDITVYAQWTPNPVITITFDSNGGTPITPQTANVTTGDTYSTPITAVTQPTQPGYLFQGWFTAQTGGMQVLYTTVVTTTTNQTLYAHWVADPTITITFNGNGGSPAAQVVPGRVSGDTFAATLAAITIPTQAGYVFTGWFTSATAGTQITASSIIPAGAIPRTVYAHWVQIPTITVTFDAQGGTPDGQTATLQTGDLYGNALSLIQSPARLGYVFAGWFTTPDGDTSGAQILDDTIVTATTNQTLYAHWIAVTVTITFDAQGGTPATQVVPGKVYGDTYAFTLASVTEPTRAFDAFLGWFTAPTGGTEITDTDTIPAADTTLYAQWAPIQITITFDALGSTPAMQEEPVTTGSTFAAPFAAVTSPTMAGNTFVGWFTQVIGGTQVFPSDIITQTTDQTLYAQWQPSIFRNDVTLSDMHYAYIIGEGNDRVAPTDFITRAEVANVLLRIVSDETRANFWTLTNPFPDVPDNGGVWYSNGVSVANAMGIMTGLPDGTFAPELYMTRAEVITAMTRFLSPEMQYGGTADMFPDISDSWAKASINLAAQLGWVQGDPYGNFNPGANMTRAEVATLVNHILARTTSDIDTTNMINWVDNADTNAWFYWAVQIASNPAPGVPARNWAALQLPNASAEDAII